MDTNEFRTAAKAAIDESMFASARSQRLGGWAAERLLRLLNLLIPLLSSPPLASSLDRLSHR